MKCKCGHPSPTNSGLRGSCHRPMSASLEDMEKRMREELRKEYSAHVRLSECQTKLNKALGVGETPLTLELRDIFDQYFTYVRRPFMRFDYVRYDESSKNLQAQFKASFEVVERDFQFLNDSRAKALALTKLEEAYMWVGKAIRARDSHSKLEEERCDS